MFYLSIEGIFLIKYWDPNLSPPSIFLYFRQIFLSVISRSYNWRNRIKIVQAEEYYWKEGELNVVGYYHANERYDDCELGSTARKIGDHIFRYFPQAAVLLVYAFINSRSWLHFLILNY
jgi:Uncharacterised protein family (UPF0172)